MYETVHLSRGVIAGGYEWVKATDPRVGSEGKPVPASFHSPEYETWHKARYDTPDLFLVESSLEFGRVYRPWTEETALFLNFAAIGTKPEGIVEFANRYGKLGVGWDRGIGGEPLWDWQFQIQTMKFLVRVWQMIEVRNRKGLANLFARKNGKIQWPDQTGETESVAPVEYVIAPDGTRELCGRSFEYRNAVFEPLEPTTTDVLTVARDYLVGLLNARLRSGAQGTGAIHPQLVLLGDERLALSAQVESLLDMLWLQFAAAVGEHKEYRGCQQCGKMFQISPDTHRTNRAFCSGACRKKAYRVRQREARRMRQEGKSLRQIVKSLDSDAKTVKNWLSK